LVDGLDLSGSVRFIGHVRHTDDLLHRASIMIAPAPAEPFGLSVVEAMARGLPVAAAAGGAHTETVATRELLFPPGDVEALALLLDGLASDVARRQRLGHSLRDRQQALFTPQAHVSELVTLYTRLLRQQ
jgi:glycosyltransferase involved in cell wall biosynthesis